MRGPLDSSKETSIRLVTWNCCRGKYASKVERLGALRPDVAVIQECAQPPERGAATAWFGTDPRQGIALLSRGRFHLAPEPARAGSGSMFAAQVHGPVNFMVVAVWAQPEPTYSEALRRGLAVYRDVLTRGPAVLLGDFNSSAAWDARHGRTDHLEFDAQLREEFGLVSAYHTVSGERPGSESRPTHYWRWHEASPYHLDYCYVPESWVPGLTSVTVGSYHDWAELSDHRPVLVEVSPSAGSARAAV